MTCEAVILEHIGLCGVVAKSPNTGAAATATREAQLEPQLSARATDDYSFNA